MSNRRSRYAKARYSSQYAKLCTCDMLIVIANSETIILTLTLCQGNYVVPSRRQPANSLTLWILAEATDQEETHAADQRPLPKMIQKEGSGSQPSASGVRYDPLTDGHETLTPPGMSTPDITAPDGGTTRGRPIGVGTAIRSVSLMTAVCSILRANLSLTDKQTCQVRELLQFFVARSLVEDRPYCAHFIHQLLLYFRIAQ